MRPSPRPPAVGHHRVAQPQSAHILRSASPAGQRSHCPSGHSKVQTHDRSASVRNQAWNECRPRTSRVRATALHEGRAHHPEPPLDPSLHPSGVRLNGYPRPSISTLLAVGHLRVAGWLSRQHCSLKGGEIRLFDILRFIIFIGWLLQSRKKAKSQTVKHRTCERRTVFLAFEIRLFDISRFSLSNGCLL